MSWCVCDGGVSDGWFAMIPCRHGTGTEVLLTDVRLAVCYCQPHGRRTLRALAG